MQTVDIRQKLHQYIDDGDEKLLKMMFALAKEYNDDEMDYIFTDEDIKEFDRRKEKRLTGESKTFGWQEAKNMIIQRKPNNGL
ncbi:MAG: hypothetical protein JSU01_23410 [Bacteroidetes bacterium]|nr:hypothetical protein [Bacteroidota bacterium]